MSLLASTGQFGWTKDFLRSGVTTFLDDNSGTICLPIPKRCPNSHALCITEMGNENADKVAEGTNQLQGLEEQTAGLDGTAMGKENEPAHNKHFDQVLTELDPKHAGNAAKKRVHVKRSAPVVDTQVRRSDRVRQGSSGFKSPGCPKSNCISCNPKPPTLSAKTIRNLGVQFCDMDPEDLAEDKLLQKEGKVDQVIKKKARKGKDKDDKEAEDGSGGPQVKHHGKDLSVPSGAFGDVFCNSNLCQDSYVRFVETVVPVGGM